MRNYKDRSPAYRLLFAIFFIGAFVTTAAWAIGEAIRFLKLDSDIRQQMEVTGNVVAGSLANTLWEIDDNRLQIQVSGVLSLPHVAYGEVQTSHGAKVSAGVLPPEQDRISHVVSLTHQGLTEQVALGNLSLIANRAHELSVFRAEALNRLWVALATFAVAFALIWWLVHRLYYTRLHALVSQLDELAGKVRSPAVRKVQNASAEDELERVKLLSLGLISAMSRENRRLQESELTAREGRDQAVHSSRLKSRFLARVSHELRTPMNSVMGFASLLNDTPLEGEQKDYADSIRRSADIMLGIVNDIIDITRIETGKLVLEPVPFDIRMTVADVVDLFGPRAEEKGVILETRTDPDLPPLVEADPVRIRQLLMNLTSNAIKYTEEGHVLVSIEVIKQSADQVRIRLVVEDTGVGISSAIRDIIFDEFQSSDDSPVSREGAGLGLAICRQLASLMGGDIGFDSEEGKGSTFWVNLKLPVVQKVQQGRLLDVSLLKGLRVLLIDSYELSTKISLELLGQCGMQFASVKTAAEALQRLDQAMDSGEEFDLLILDDFLLDMEGADFCQLLTSSPHWSNIPMLILSSYPQRGDAGRFGRIGAKGFLPKAMREQYLVAIVRQIVSDMREGRDRIVTRFTLQPEEPIVAEPPVCDRDFSVLLVEDNAVNQQVTEKMLQKCGCQVDTADNGREAIEKCSVRNYRLVFMDCLMPVMDGYEATQAIRQYEKKNGRQAVPIIALTANVMEGEEERCRQAGMDDFIRKPVKPEKLREIVMTFCDTRSEATS